MSKFSEEYVERATKSAVSAGMTGHCIMRAAKDSELFTTLKDREDVEVTNDWGMVIEFKVPLYTS